VSDFRVDFAVALAAFGVDLTVTPPESGPVATQGVWDASPPVEERPYGTDLARREPRRILALPRTALPSSPPRGSVIEAPEAAGGPMKTWTVDGLDRAEWDCWRVIVKLAIS